MSEVFQLKIKRKVSISTARTSIEVWHTVTQ